MEVQGKLIDISRDYATKKLKLTFLINTNINSPEKLMEAELLDIEAKKHRNRRSTNANAYAWKLITEIADVLGESKDKLYENMLYEYGQVKLYPTLKNEPPDGYFKYYRFFQEGYLNGKECDWYKVAKGSSEYDTKEMSIFIDGVVQEAKELGIEIMTPQQIEALKQEWGKWVKA